MGSFTEDLTEEFILLESLISEESLIEAIAIVSTAERTVNPLRILCSRLLTEASDFLAKPPKEIPESLKGLMGLGVFIYLLRIAIAIYYIVNELMENYNENEHFDFEAAKLTFQTYGIDALDAVIWAGILILLLAGGPGIVIAPLIFVGYGFDLGESFGTYSKKIAGIDQKIATIKNRIEKIQARNNGSVVADSPDAKTLMILEKQQTKLEEQKELHELNRNIGRGLAYGSFLNAGLLLSMQVCVKFGLLLALSSVVPPLTIAILSIFVLVSVVSVVYTFAVHKPQDKKLEAELAALEREEEGLELEQAKPALTLEGNSSKQTVLQSPEPAVQPSPKMPRSRSLTDVRLTDHMSSGQMLFHLAGSNDNPGNKPAQSDEVINQPSQLNGGRPRSASL